MLSIFITDNNGIERRVESAVSVVLNSECDVPADDLTVTMAYNGELSDNADMITAYMGDKVVFRGRIDEITNLCNNRQIVTKISARSLAGILLDNEAEPVAYYRPSDYYIFKRYAEPYGITADVSDEVPYAGMFRIDKGMTEWQVLESYCGCRYGTLPRITGSGELLMYGCVRDDMVVFGRGGIEYTSISENHKRCKLISEVRLKMDENLPYSSFVRNEISDCGNIKRVRYVNTAADNITLSTADRIIENGNRKSYNISLECVGCCVDILGCKAVLNDSRLGKIENLVVDSLKYYSGKDGEYTAVTLRKEK